MCVYVCAQQMLSMGEGGGHVRVAVEEAEGVHVTVKWERGRLEAGRSWGGPRMLGPSHSDRARGANGTSHNALLWDIPYR